MQINEMVKTLYQHTLGRLTLLQMLALMAVAGMVLTWGLEQLLK